MNRKFAKQKRKVAMVLDNCPSHPHIIPGLKAIKMIFLPPNTTSVTQPMDQDIIANIKHYYRSALLQQRLLAIDILAYWTRCDIYRKRGLWLNSQLSPTVFVKLPTAPLTPSDDRDDELPLATSVGRLHDTGFGVNGTAADYLSVDDQLETTASLTDQAIIATVQEQSMNRVMTAAMKMIRP